MDNKFDDNLESQDVLDSQIDSKKDKRKKRLIITTQSITRAAIIACIYFISVYAIKPISYGPLQFRIGEAMTLLPIIFPESIVGLTIGCLIANILSPFGWYDMVIGTIATLIAAVLTFAIGKFLAKKSILIRSLVGAIPPILVNALILPLIWLLFSGNKMYWLNFAMILATQTGTIIVLGIPLLFGLDKYKLHIS